MIWKGSIMDQGKVKKRTNFVAVVGSGCIPRPSPLRVSYLRYPSLSLSSLCMTGSGFRKKSWYPSFILVSWAVYSPQSALPRRRLWRGGWPGWRTGTADPEYHSQFLGSSNVLPGIIESSARVKNAKIWRFACRKFETNFPRKGIVRPQSQCPHSWFIYSQCSHDRSAYSAAGKYVVRSQTHECGNWDWGRTIPFLGIHKWDFRCSAKVATEGQHALVPVSGNNNRARTRQVPSTVIGHKLTAQYMRTDIWDGISKRLRSPGIDFPSLCSLAGQLRQIALLY